MAAPNLTPPAPRIPLPSHLMEQLCAPLPPEAITPHPSKAYLSSIKNIYCIERLNQVFGIGGWQIQTHIVENDPSKRMVVVKVTFLVEEYGILLEQFGGHDNEDRGDAYKGAVTDALSKIGSYLGIGMDVYKGYGPTKQTPKPKRAPQPLDRTAVKSQPALVPPQPVVAHIEELPEFEYEEVPSELEQQLADSQVILDAFGQLKARYRDLGMLRTYEGYLNLHGTQSPAGFHNAEEARECFKVMLADLRGREEGKR